MVCSDYLSFIYLDSVSSATQAALDATKNAAASAVDKGSSLIGSAKGIYESFY